jgi:hypothetical protein
VAGLLGAEERGTWRWRTVDASLRALEAHVRVARAGDNWLARLFWRLGVETGWVMRALCEAGVVWGYFIDHDEVWFKGARPFWGCAAKYVLMNRVCGAVCAALQLAPQQPGCRCGAPRGGRHAAGQGYGAAARPRRL